MAGRGENENTMNNEEKISEHVPVSISELSKRGYQLLKEDHIAEAEENFRRILEVEPQNNYALVGMGDAARKRKSYHEAIRYYEECLGYHVGNKYALVGLGEIPCAGRQRRDGAHADRGCIPQGA